MEAKKLSMVFRDTSNAIPLIVDENGIINDKMI